MNSYFPHDSNARNSDKLLPVRMKYGAEGYGIYFMILERLREEADYASVKDYNMLAFDLRADAAKVKSIIEDFGLFAFTEKGECFYSEGFKKRMELKDQKNHKLSEAGKRGAEKRWGSKDEIGKLKPGYSHPIANAIKKDSKESKEKESKEKKKKDIVELELDDLSVMERESKTSLDDTSLAVSEIVDYLNQKTGAKYRSSAAKTKAHIRARLSEGFTVTEFKRVIDHKTSEWLDDAKMQKYLRPETLFATKFESYLNNARLAERRSGYAKDIGCHGNYRQERPKSIHDGENEHRPERPKSIYG